MRLRILLLSAPLLSLNCHATTTLAQDDAPLASRPSIEKKSLPRTSFLKMNQGDYDLLASSIVQKHIEHLKGWQKTTIKWAIPAETPEKGWHCVFTYQGEKSPALYYLKSSDEIVPFSNSTPRGTRFERLINEDTILWSETDPKDPRARVYSVFSLSECTSSSVPQMPGFWMTIFDKSLRPLVLVKRHSLDHKEFFCVNSASQLVKFKEKKTLRGCHSHTFYDPESDSAFFFDVDDEENDARPLSLLHKWDLARDEMSLIAINTNLHEDQILFSVPGGHNGPLQGFCTFEKGKRTWSMAPSLQFIVNKVIKKIQKETKGTPFALEYLEMANHQTIEFTLEFDRQPQKKGHFSLETSTITWLPDPSPLITHLRSLSDQLQPVQFTEVTSFDGFKIPTLFVTPNTTNSPTPTVFLIHGGPHDEFNWRFSPLMHLLNSRGLAVIVPNFRGSSYSIQTALKGTEEWGQGMQKDLHATIEWAIEKRITDPQNVGFWGGSYGGYATLIEATTPYTSKSFPGIKCASAECPATDLSKMVMGMYEEIGEGNEAFKALDRRLSVSTPDSLDSEVIAKLGKLSPLPYAKNVKIPLMLGHGLQDTRLHFTHSKSFSAALKKEKIPHIFVNYLRARHDHETPKDILAHFALQENFFCHHLGLSAETFGTALSDASLTIEEGIDLLPGLKEAVEHSAPPSIKY
jgi:acetyl esterase/lipase